MATVNQTSCSSLFNNTITKIIQFNPKQPFSISATNTAKLVSFKPISLFNAPSFPSLSLRRRVSAASFDGLEVKDESFSSEEQDPETELPQNEKQDESEDMSSDDNSGGEGDDSGRLYVGNLAYSTNSSQLAEIFSQAGSVLNVEVIYDKVTDRSRGFAFVTMANAEQAQEAIRLFDGSEIGGRSAKVNVPQVPRGGERDVMGAKMRDINKGYVDTPHKIYAGNLSWRVTSTELRAAFAAQQGVMSAKVIYERDTGRSRGFGFVSFESPEAARAARDALNGVELEGRPLRLNLADERGGSPSSIKTTVVASEGSEGSELVENVNV